MNTLSADTVERFWDNRPCNLYHSDKKVGTREYFVEVGIKKYRAEPHILDFVEFDRWRGKSVLEIGCGLGTDTINFAQHGARVTAVDLSKNSLDLARKRAEVFNVSDRVDFFHCNCQKLSEFIPLKSYDLIYSFGVIHHTPEPQKAIRELKKYMGSESELRIMVYSKISYKLFWIMKQTGNWDLSQTETLLAEYSEAQIGCPITYTYTFEEIREELLDGFEIVDIVKDHIFTWDIELYKKHVFKKDPAWKNVSDQYLRQIAKELGWHTLVKAKLAR